MFFGDSNGLYPDLPNSYPTQIGGLRKWTKIINACVSGDTVQDLLDRFADDVAAHNPSAVSIWVGTNDLIATSLGDFETRLTTLVELCLALGSRVTLCTIPVNRDPTYEPEVADYADVIRDVATAHPGVELFDVHALFVTYDSGELDDYMVDNDHVSADGVQQLVLLAQQPGNELCFTGGG